MSNNLAWIPYQPPPIPGTSGQLPGANNFATAGSPWFSVSNQFLPRNLHDVIRWAKYITTQSPVTTEVIRKFATYPITDFIIKTKSEATKAKYEEIFKSFRLKSALHNVGFEYYTVGNVFLSIYFPIHRTLVCPDCKAHFAAKSAEFTKFKNYEFVGDCPQCNTKGVTFERRDTKSISIEDMNLIQWDPINIQVNFNPITGEYEYYYKIPNDVKRKVREGDKLFVNSVPWGFIEAIKNNQDFKFDKNNLFHLQNLSAGQQINGIAVPPLVSLFYLVFYQATLRKANESIATDFMSPLRVIFPQAQTQNGDPVAQISLRNFVERMQANLVKHKQDNNHIVIAPTPIGYQAISGEGKNLLVATEIQQAEDTILMALGVSRELLAGTTNWTSSTTGLRLLENTMLCYTGQVEELISWIMSRVSKYLGIETCDVELTPFKLTDDPNLQQMLIQTASANNGSLSSLYESFGMKFTDELDKMREDAVARAVNEVKTKLEVDQSTYLAARETGDTFDRNNDYRTALAKAQQIAETIYSVDDGTKRAILNRLKLEDYAMYILVGKLLEEYEENQQKQMEMQAAGSGEPGKPGQPGQSGKDGPPGKKEEESTNGAGSANSMNGSGEEKQEENAGGPSEDSKGNS
jgi:hypothetical protein